MPGSRRTVLGHVVMRLGLVVRRISLPACVLAGVALVAWSLLNMAAGPGARLPSPSPFDASARVGIAVWLVEAIVAVGGLLLGLRLLAFAIGGLGWRLLLPDHRDMLSRLGDQPPASAREGDQYAGSPDQTVRAVATPAERRRLPTRAPRRRTGPGPEGGAMPEAAARPAPSFSCCPRSSIGCCPSPRSPRTPLSPTPCSWRPTSRAGPPSLFPSRSSSAPPFRPALSRTLLTRWVGWLGIAAVAVALASRAHHARADEQHLRDLRNPPACRRPRLCLARCGEPGACPAGSPLEREARLPFAVARSGSRFSFRRGGVRRGWTSPDKGLVKARLSRFPAWAGGC